MFPNDDQEIISVGDTAADLTLPPGINVVSLDIKELDDSRRNFNLTLSIDKASYLEDGYITCDDTTSRKRYKDICPIGKLNGQFLHKPVSNVTPTAKYVHTCFVIIYARIHAILLLV